MFYILMLLAILASNLLVLASPLPDSSALERRITHTGRGTWFNVGEGNCGEYNVNSDKIIALSLAQYGSGDNCGQWVHITNVANGNAVYAMTRDSCQSCKYGDLDMSPGAFEELAPLSQGVIGISWHFMAKGWSP